MSLSLSFAKRNHASQMLLHFCDSLPGLSAFPKMMGSNKEKADIDRQQGRAPVSPTTYKVSGIEQVFSCVTFKKLVNEYTNLSASRREGYRAA
jgi:hypothetical protein